MPSSRTKPPPVAVDLFCGAGGLTHGLARAGIRVAAGIDLDPACRFPFEANNSSRFIGCDIAEVTAAELTEIYPVGATRIIAGCAPCQPFSRYSRGKGVLTDHKWGLLTHFGRLVEGVRPTIVTMENVSGLERQEVFLDFMTTLKRCGYYVSHSNVFCPAYGVPQQRTRLVLLASLMGRIQLVPPTHPPNKYRTVHDAISRLPPLGRGQVDPHDHLHRACDLTERNLQRIRASKPGGHWREWPIDLVADCHRVESGKNYVSVYGRMHPAMPSPTITTQFFGFGNGRFGHPNQDRAISLREGALLQSFPKNYLFHPKPSEASFALLGRLIGNAVPVRLGEIIGRSILKHLKQCGLAL